jgi:hypothetical protein
MYQIIFKRIDDSKEFHISSLHQIGFFANHLFQYFLYHLHHAHAWHNRLVGEMPFKYFMIGIDTQLCPDLCFRTYCIVDGKKII